jgi:uncharacterized protein
MRYAPRYGPAPKPPCSIKARNQRVHAELEGVLKTIPRPAIAVSGGVDSMTLAVLASHLLPDVRVVHASSPAVPPEATLRVQRFAQTHGWELDIIDAGEFDDPEYRANPANRCFYCKSNLYQTIRSRTDRPILSGANLDDLREYRPGLDAARRHGVRHPYVEAGLTKPQVRAVARALGLHAVAELPASPCLSSRVETGIRIETATLGFIHAVETLVTRTLSPVTVRCRVRATAVVIELDPMTLARLSPERRRQLADEIAARQRVAEPLRPEGLPIAFAEYRNGSAFLVEHA